jgi:hypothetical protein
VGTASSGCRRAPSAMPVECQKQCRRGPCRPRRRFPNHLRERLPPRIWAHAIPTPKCSPPTTAISWSSRPRGLCGPAWRDWFSLRMFTSKGRHATNMEPVVSVPRLEGANGYGALADPATMNDWTSRSLSLSVRAGLGSRRGPNRSMSGSNQHLMRINLRRMELSAFIEVPCAHRSKGGDRAARKAPRRKRQCRPRSCFLMVSR